jgi:hypothetical protein
LLLLFLLLLLLVELLLELLELLLLLLLVEAELPVLALPALLFGHALLGGRLAGVVVGRRW